MESRARVPVLATIGCAAAFAVVLVLAYAVPAAGRVDATALSGFEALRGPVATPLANDLAHAADPLPVIAIVLSLVALGVAAGRRWQAVAAATLVGASVVTAEVLKVALAHPRVHAVLGVDQIGAVAFPSGHTAAAMSVALAAILVVPRRLRPVAIVPAAAYGVGVCGSLLVLGWHFPSDVFGGMLVAAFYFCVAVAGLRIYAGRENRGGDAEPARWDLRAPRRWREALLVALGLIAVLTLSRAGALAAFASAHTIATAVAIAVAAGGTALICVAGVIADR